MKTFNFFYVGATIPFKIETADILNISVDGVAPPLDATAITLIGYRTIRNSEGDTVTDAPVIYSLSGAQIARVSEGVYDCFHQNAQRGLWFWKTTATIGGRDFVTVLSLQVEAGPG